MIAHDQIAQKHDPIQDVVGRVSTQLESALQIARSKGVPGKYAELRKNLLNLKFLTVFDLLKVLRLLNETKYKCTIYF